MNSVPFLTGNHILNAALIAWLIAQLLKILIVLLLEGRFDLTRLTGSGGMPSSHSAVVVATALSCARVCGFASAEFAICAVLAFIVMYDASGVRRAAGEQAKILNYIMDNWSHQTPELFKKELKVLLGHTPLQVLAGAVLGGLIGWFL